MLNVSFSEILVIAVITLLVIGPEKLPKVARTIGALTGRLQRYVGQVKEEVNRELRFEELQKLQQDIKQSAETMQSNIQQQAATIENAITSHDGPLEETKPLVAQKPIRKARAAKSGEAASKKTASVKTLTKKVET
jgi:sec-independent protein translocase protein TatB